MKKGARRSLFGVAVVLGLMLGLETHIDRRSSASAYGSYLAASDALASEMSLTPKLSALLAREQVQLRAQIAAASHAATGVTLLRDEVTSIERAAGLTTVTGHGLVIRIAYDPQLPVIAGLHYVDEATQLQMVVNLLSASGAQAIAINGQRLVTTSSIRSVSGLTSVPGPFSGAVQVNGEPILAPYVLRVIGPVVQMKTTLAVEGIGDQFTILDQSFTLSDVANLTVPAYTGVLPGRYSKEVGQ